MRKTWLLLPTFAALAACAKTVPIKEMHRLLDLQGPGSVEQQGVTVTLTPIDVRNYASQVEQFTYEDRWPVCGQEAQGPVALYSTTEKVFPVRIPIFEPCCTFKLRVENYTGHTLTLAGATIQLEDGQGRTYDLLGPPWPTLQKTYSDLLSRGNFHTAKVVLAAGSQSVPVPAETDKILPGKFKEFILPFDASEAPAPLKVMVYDLVTETDAAGTPTAKSNFEFPVGVEVRPMWRAVGSGGGMAWSAREPATCP